MFQTELTMLISCQVYTMVLQDGFTTLTHTIYTFLCLFGRMTPFLFHKLVAKALGWSSSFTLYFSQNTQISLFIVCTHKSMTVLCRNHGALVNLCKLSMFESLSVPHSCIPYVQVGFRMDLNSRILLSRVICDVGPISKLPFGWYMFFPCQLHSKVLGIYRLGYLITVQGERRTNSSAHCSL